MKSRPRFLLFADGLLGDDLAAAAQAGRDRLAGCNPDALLSASEADVTEDLVRFSTFDLPTLLREDAYLEEPAEVSQPGHDIIGRPIQATVTRFTLVVPTSGPPSFFLKIPTAHTLTPVYAEIDEQARCLRLRWDATPAGAGAADGAEIRAHFDQQLDQISQRLASTRADVEVHNQRMAREIPAAVAQRRAKLLTDRKTQASIGYPIKRRADAASYSVPITRRKISSAGNAPIVPTGNPYAPEPALADADYEAALAVLRNARNGLERSPSLSSKLGEEEIRDLLLITLNGQFEGAAAGEVFNYAGKTDILIRAGDRNVFIGECKIFDPANKQSVERVITDALDQLLSYLAWRDTKAALILFIRDTDVSVVVEKALAAIRNHPSHKRADKISSEERHDFVIRANGDVNREIHLAFLPFLIGSRKP